MLIGLFVRHYKVFRGINFIPISQGSYFSSFIGPNGIGKSSILDALDKVFNGGDWSINIQAKREGGIWSDDKTPFIAPVFAIPKEKISSKDESETAQILSDYLWNFTATTDQQKKFSEYRENLSNEISKDSHYLLILGKRANDLKATSLGPFSIQKVAGSDDTEDFEANLAKLYKLVFELYLYVYVPVETDAVELTKLESREMVKLLDHDIQKEIERAITVKSVNDINARLDQFLEQIHSHLDGYKYKGHHKDKLTMTDLVQKVFEAFFSIKILHRNDGNSTTPISVLSSGEKRRAFVDVAYSFLKRRADRDKAIIMAIDEPDASLHIAACHDQFEKLTELSSLTKPATQVIATTHWYGFLPIIAKGTAHSLSQKDDKVAFDTLDLYRFREQVKHAVKASKGMLPTDIQLKSYNDLTQAIVSSVVRDEPYNWILCEGLSDKIYLEFYLSDLIKSKKLRILPLGGFKEVKKIFEYLTVPLNDQEYTIKGKILCIVDTDAQFVDFTPIAAKNSDFKRIVYKNGNIVLVPYADQLKQPTEIEDCLDPKPFYETLTQIIDNQYSNNPEFTNLIKQNPYISDTNNSLSSLNLRPSDRMTLTGFFDIDDNKVKFAHAYILKADVNHAPAWIEEIKTYFTIKKK